MSPKQADCKAGYVSQTLHLIKSEVTLLFELLLKDVLGRVLVS